MESILFNVCVQNLYEGELFCGSSVLYFLKLRSCGLMFRKVLLARGLWERCARFFSYSLKCHGYAHGFWRQKTQVPSLNSGSSIYGLYNLGQTTSLLWSWVSSYIKWSFYKASMRWCRWNNQISPWSIIGVQ